MLLWEFVGGKVKQGETKEQALIRGCKEELNITLNVGGCFYGRCSRISGHYRAFNVV